VCDLKGTTSIQSFFTGYWMPAFAGMTTEGLSAADSHSLKAS
jgi:hypothetical protein